MKFHIFLGIILLLFLCALVIAFFSVRKFLSNHLRYYKKGRKAYSKGDYTGAKTLFEKTLSLCPTFADAMYMLGSANFMLKQYDDAKKSYENVLEFSPKHYSTLYNLGLTLQMQKKHTQALEFYIRALETDNSDPDGYFNAGVINFELKNYEAARELFEKADKLAPNRDDILFYINRCKDELCNYNDLGTEQILAEYERFSDKKVDDNFNLVLARAYAKAGKIEKSMEQCKKAFALNSSNAQLYRLMGLLELVQKNPQKAKNYLSEAVSLAPSEPEAYNLLAYAFLHLQNKSEYEKYKNKYEQLNSII